MSTKSKATAAKATTGSDKLMYRLLVEAENDFNNDRRSKKRYPFFRPVSVKVDDRIYSAFAREISATGFGLLHNMQLPLKEVGIVVAGHRQTLRAEVERCEPCGEGWYISGCKVFDTSN